MSVYVRKVTLKARLTAPAMPLTIPKGIVRVKSLNSACRCLAANLCVLLVPRMELSVLEPCKHAAAR